jgi:glycosyltransferase involved in cell wall biosynthesis
MVNSKSGKKIVYIDGSALINNPQAGIGQYTSELVTQLADYADLRLILLLFNGEDAQLKHVHNIEIEYLPMSRKAYAFTWKYIHPMNINGILKHRNPDFIIYPNFATSPLVKSKNTKIISVIHDLTYIHFPDTVERKNKFFLRKAVARSAKLSDHIFFPSKFSRDDFKKYYHTNASLHIAHPGYTQSLNLDKVRNDIDGLSKRPFLLFIGTIEPRKNLEKLCDAYLKSNFYLADIPLVLAGKKGWGSTAIPINKNIITLGKITNSERNHLLDKCISFIFPSIFEGFGMPIVEAMQHKKPVVASLNSSMNEIINSNNAYCIPSPFEAQNILPLLDSLKDDLDRRTQVVEKKTQRAYEDTAIFTWSNCAKPYIDILRNA